ncbi:MAG: Wzz/FepE/Etk N-terminal domain-containing protein [Bacteroidia bacterium]|nr:Wzz/FepE/Etk N-terminal domain-containing protein [Bacteroidia bacterium]
MDLINFLRVLSRRKWLILAITSIALITTYLIAMQAPAVYKVSAQLSTGLSDFNNPFILNQRNRPLQKFELETKLKTLVETIKNPVVLSQVSYQLYFHDLKKSSQFRSWEKINSNYSAAELENAKRNFQERSDSLLALRSSDEIDAKHLGILKELKYDAKSLASTLKVARIPGTDLIQIIYASENPHLSQFVANTLCQEFIRYNFSNRALQSRQSTEFFARQVDIRKAELTQRIREWENYRRQNGLSEVENPMGEMFQVIERFELERDEMSRAKSESEEKLENLRNRANLTIPYSIQAYMNLDDRGGEKNPVVLNEKMARLSYNYVHSYFQNDKYKDSLMTVSQDLEEALFPLAQKMNPQSSDDGAIQEAVEEQVKVELYRDRIKAINIELRQMSREPSSFASLQSEPSVYAQEVERARDVYLLALTKLNEAELASQGFDTGSISQVAFVQPPQKPEPSNILLLTILSGLVALSLGIVVTFVLEYLDTSVKFPSQFGPLTGLPLLGSLNQLNTNNLDLVSLFSETHKNKSLETYKQLLRKIRFEVTENNIKSLLITSTKDGVGKTSFMVSLAYSLSLNGKKVILIDTNFKDKSLTEIIGADPSLEKYLNGEISRRKLITPSLFDGVDVIGCEGGNLSPSEIFPEDRFQDLMEDLSNNYDLILMEGSPLNSYADSRELAKYVGKVIPVFSAAQGINQRDKASINYLRDLDEQVMGAILNKVELRNLNL